MEFDRISALPDPLLAHILSYLSISNSFKTSVLSKRWEFLWLKVSVLDLTTVRVPLREKAILSRMMRRFLELNRGSCLKKFNITMDYNYFERVKEITFFDFSQEKKKVRYHDSKDCNNGVMELIAEVIHRGVQHLEVSLMPQGATNLMPKYVYVSKTLVSLKLANVGLEDHKFVSSLPNLKMMHLQNIYYENQGGLLIIKKLISASPLLEDLTFDFPGSREPLQTCFLRMPKVINIFQNFSDSPKLEETDDLTIVPQCFISTLEYVRINQLIMKKQSGINLVNYFLVNSAILKKLTLSFTDSSLTSQEHESYKKLLTHKTLSPTCQVVFD